MPFARRPDARIWRDQGGTGDPILLIMGHAYGAEMWHRTAPERAASYSVIRFGNRGAGRSTDPPGRYPVPLMAADALAVLDAAGAASAHGRLAEIRVPALVMRGARDRIVPAAGAQRLAGGIAGARLVMFPDAGHAYITDVTRAASQEVLHVLAGISGPAGGSSSGPRPAASTAETSR